MRVVALSIVFAFPLFLYSQVHHELKFDVLGAVTQHPRLSYEYIAGKNFGLEIAVGYLDDDIELSDYNSTGSYLTYAIDRTFFTVDLTGKYYFLSQQRAAGAFFGFFARNEIKLSQANGYEEAYQDIYGHLPTQKLVDESFLLGGVVGYKFIVDKRWVIQGQLALARDLNTGLEITATEADLFLVIGYRW